ncbi:unannotated protein [freshwater metagenome]|uniref:Unannotated protein n=1 Tax=freshwater metagenome TaxID=449393 RepID=A0A6J7KAM3_9ZZZZ|nr:hypothetical protein [Actinomycetota bacterium]
MTVLQLKKPIDYACPDWCENPDHSPGELGDGPLHYGPEFGVVSVQGGAGDLHAMIGVGDDTVFIESPTTLRQHAADMVRAAEWLEANR